MSIKDYKELDVWKKGIDIVDFVYEITEKFPKEEKFNLAAHMQKTAVSIPANVGVPRKRFSYSSHLKGGDHGNTLQTV